MGKTEGIAPVLMIGLDAAEPSLIERWMDDGSLPNLRRLRDGGTYGRLASTADWLVGSPWPTFYTGTTPGNHGFYHYLTWRSDRMEAMRPSADFLPLRPFWRNLASSGIRTVTVDVPLTYPPEPFDGIEISGWATHELLAPTYAYPPSVMDWVNREIGPSPRTEELHSLLEPRLFSQVRDDLIRATRRVADLCLALMEREPWNLFLICLCAPHRGGHNLWSFSGVTGAIPANEREEMSDALRQVYISCDDAVGRLVEKAGNEATTFIFSLHGMGHNTSRADLLPQMLSRILAGPVNEKEKSDRVGLLKRLRGMIPNTWRHVVKSRLPLFLQDKLTTFWRMGGIDWKMTRAVSLVADLQGYIRINLRGRETAGIVEPGAEYDRLCIEIEKGLRSFVDADTNEPVVETAMRMDRLFPPGLHRDDLPDLVVNWKSTAVSQCRAIISRRYGSIPWPTPGKNPDGRSGNHRPEGFLLAAGERIRGNERIENAHILDLAPTVCALLGAPEMPDLQGQVLPVAKTD